MTPSPDKLEIPEAAVEAMLAERARWGDGFTSTGRYFVYRLDDDNDEIEISNHPDWASMEAAFALASTRAMLLAAVPHMPDRGYAEGIEAAAKVAEDRPLWARHGMFSGHRSAANCIAAEIRALAPPAPADNGKPATHDEESILDVISGNLRMESWVAGKTLTVMFDMESGERRFAKLRLTKIAAQPSPADLKGEPE